jgi:hypothetical protein
VDWEATQADSVSVFDLFQFQMSLLQEFLKANYPDIVQRELRSCQVLLAAASHELGPMLSKQLFSYFEQMKLPLASRRSLFWLFLASYYWSQTKDALLARLLAAV